MNRHSLRPRARHTVEASTRKERRAPRRLALWTLFVLALLSGSALAYAMSQTAAASSSLSYTWSMPERIGADADKDGLVDYPTSAAYLNPTSWRVDLDACRSQAITDRGAGTRVDWTITGAALTKPVTVTGTCALSQVVPKLGSYTIKAALSGQTTIATSQTVTLKDVLLVSVGDSVASGEGNPDTLGPRQVGPFPFYKPKWEDQQCHRTALAGPAQAAIRMEKRDPHSSVTFLHLACSGAEIDTGLLEPYEGIEPKIDGVEQPKKKAQLEDAVTLASGRKIDSLLVSIGANNMGFGNIVKACLALTDCHTTDQVPGGGDNASAIYTKGVAKLPALYRQLDGKLDELGKAGKIDKVFISEYYDVSQFDDGATCTGQTPQERAGNRNPENAAVDGFTKGEMAWTHDVVTPGINKAVADAAAAANQTAGPAWTVVDGIDEDFAKHGYCAKDRWIRQLFESVAYQHDQNGAFHPNTEGHLFGYAKNIERVVAPADGIGGTPVPFAPDERVKLSLDGVSNVLAALDDLDAFESIARSIPFGGREFMQQGVQQVFSWMKQGQAKLKEISDRSGVTLTELENLLDDLDGDGDPTSDVHIPGLDALVVDLDVDISPKLLTTSYEVRVKIDVSIKKDSTLAMLADGLKLNGQKLTGDIGFAVDTTLTVNPFAIKKVTIPAKGVRLGTLSLGLAGSYDKDSTPLSFDVGLLKAQATGTVNADIGVALTLVDKDGSGVIDATQLNAVPDLFRLSCVSKGAAIRLDVGASFAGLGAKVGSISLQDRTLCDGISPPEVELGDLGQFRNVSFADLINGLAQVTQAIQTAQATGELDLPFVSEPLSKLVSVNERLVRFFVDNGFTDPKNPLAAITVDSSTDAKLSSLQALAPALAKALGLPAEALDMRWSDGRIVFTLQQSSDPAARANAGTLDFGDSLENNGVAGLAGTARATVDPKYSLDLGFGFDLRPGLALQDRFFLTNGSKGYLFTLDADITADVDLTGTASVASLRLTDGNPDGPVTLLRRKDASKPMIAVTLAEPDPRNSDGRVTLAELATTVGQQALPVSATINATVPSTDLAVRADVIGQQIASGKITIAWPSVPDLSGPGRFTATGDASFNASVLPLAFDTANPRALIGQVLSVTREAITKLRAAVASGTTTARTPLPLVGKSVADLDPVLARVQTALDDLIATNEFTTLSALRVKINQLLSRALGVADGTAADLVTFTYEARTDNRPAAVVVGLELGACTDDRPGTGCTTSRAPLNVPFNLQLGPGSKAGGVAGLGTAGEVKVSYDARAKLTFGVQLPSVTAGASPGELPVVSGTPTLFVQDDTGFTAGFGVRFQGTLSAAFGPLQVALGTSGNPARAGLAVRFALKSANPSGKRFAVGSTAFADFLGGLIPKSGPVTVHEADRTMAASCPGVTGPVDACASLPVYVGTTSLGTVTFAAPDLLTPSGWTFDSSQVEAALGNEAIRFSLMVDGVRTLAAQLQEALRNLPAGTRVPLLGTDVTTAADVVKTFDEKVLTKVNTLSDVLANVPTVDEARAKAKQILDSIGIIRAGGGAAVAVTCRSGSAPTTCAGSEPLSALQSLEVRLPLSLEVTRSLGTFDIGFPGLRLSSDQAISGTAGLDVNLAFGIDRTLGFYVPTAGSEPELALRVSGRLPATMSGELAFLPIALKDLTPGVDDVTVKAGVDLTTTRPDGRLPLQDLSSAQFAPSLSASAAVHLGLATERPQGASSLPVFKADVLVDAGVTFGGTGSAKPVTNATVTFDHVAVDGGSFVTDFLKPVARELRKITGPLEKPIDEIRKPIPGLSDAAKLAGKAAVTWYGAFKEIDKLITPPGKESGLQLIDRVISFVDLVRAIDDDSGTGGDIPIGSFSVDTSVAAAPVTPEAAAGMITGSSLVTENVMDKIRLTDNAGNGAKDTAALAAANKTGGFTFPAFEKPTQLFSMLLGKDVPLVHFDAGRLEIERSFQLAYPVGPAKLYIGGMAGLSGHFAVGFDTYGIRKAFEVLGDGDASNNGVWDLAKGLLQGLYIDDRDRAGNDVPEISLQAELTAGASVGVPGFNAGAEGGIHGQIDFNLHTEDEQNGRIRYPDIARQFAVNPNPVCFFDASAQVDAFIRLYVETPLGRAEYPIASGTVWKQEDLLAFCRTKVDEVPKPRLGELGSDGTLTLATGDDAQSIFLTQTAVNTFTVSADGIVETFSPVKKIVADLKAGDDQLDIERSGGLTNAVPVLVCGGPGNDRIGTQVGPATLVGDGGNGCAAVATTAAGNDTVLGSDLSDTLDGGPGNDALIGGGATDILRGGADNDVLRGGLGDDTLDGGAGDDTTDYGDHGEPVAITLPGPSGSSGEKDTATEVENVYGGTAKDTVTLPATGTFRVDGGTGDDTVSTAGATSLVIGGEGNDTVTGGNGATTVLGGGGDDTLVDGRGSQTFLGQDGRDTVDYSGAPQRVVVTVDGVADDGADGADPDNVIDADVVIGSRFADQLTGSAAAEELRGGPGADQLTGGPGADTLRGGDDADELEGDSGDDTLDGGAGADVLVGGNGADDYSGGAGDDVADYSARTEGLEIWKDDLGNDGSALDSYRDNVRTDVEKVVGGAGRDYLHGHAGSDTLVGGPGDDVLEGRQGTDLLLGEDGDDVLYDDTVNTRFGTSETADDTYRGGPGDDTVYGNGGKDTYDMGSGADSVFSGPGDDVIVGGDGNDDLHGGAGKDTIDGDNGDDNVWGDAGDDVLRQNSSERGLGSVRGGTGNDTLYNGVDNGGSVYSGDDGSATDPDRGPNTQYGYGGTRNTYYGSGGPDRLILGDGDNEVYAGDGADTISTGNGANTVRGDGGDDTVTTGSGSDRVYGGAGDDTVDGGAGEDNLQGGADDDTLRGGADDDVLLGGTGDDVLDGGGNADELSGEDGADTVTYASRTEPVRFDEVGASNDGGDSDRSSRAGATYRDYVYSDVETVVGGEGADTLTVGTTSRTGPATLVGNGGNDTLTVSDATPTRLVGGAGDDTLTGGDGADVFDQGPKADGADVMVGKGGSDSVDYSARRAGSAYVTLDGVANDGGAGEGDNVGVDVELAPGAAGGVAPAPKVSVSPARVAEGRAGARPVAVVRVTLSDESSRPVTVPWSLAAGSATAGRDFAPAAGTVTVPAGATTASISATVLGDALDEADESFAVRLGTPTGAVAGTGSAAVVIVDDDAAPTVAIAGSSVAEGKAGAKTRLTFTVRLSAASGKAVSVRVATMNGTAVSGSDYVAARATLSFAPGQTVRTFAVTVRGDKLVERNEVFYAQLGSPVNTTVRVAKAAGTIRNDDRSSKR